MILGLHRQALVRMALRRPLRHRPRLQRPVNRQPEIVVQPRRGVLLHYERTSVLFRWTGLQPQLGHRLRQARASAVTPPALSRVRGSGARNLFYLRFCSRGFVPPFPARLETATLRVAPLRSCRLGRAVKLPLPPILFQLTHRFVRLRFLSALDLCSLYTPAYALRLPIPAVLQASPGSVSREPAPRGLRALQRRLSGTARRLERLPQEHPLLRPGQAVEAEGLLGLANFSRCQMCSAGQATE